MRFLAMVFLVLCSHLLLDFFTLDFTPPYGLPLFWPFPATISSPPAPFFINITRSPHSVHFFASLFSRHNLKAALLEIGILGGCRPAGGRRQERPGRRPAEAADGVNGAPLNSLFKSRLPAGRQRGKTRQYRRNHVASA